MAIVEQLYSPCMHGKGDFFFFSFDCKLRSHTPFPATMPKAKSSRKSKIIINKVEADKETKVSTFIRTIPWLDC